MLTISSAVEQIVASSDFAIEGLQTGCLNLSAYAETICAEVSRLTRKTVQKGSIVVALARLAPKYRSGQPREADAQLFNLVSRSGLTELAYAKTPGLQTSILGALNRPDVQTAAFCVASIGLGEIAIMTHAGLAESIRAELGDYTPALYVQGLSSLTMQVEAETINTPGQLYVIIKQLALRNINVVEYMTSSTELTLILYERDLKESFAILHDKFFKVA